MDKCRQLPKEPKWHVFYVYYFLFYCLWAQWIGGDLWCQIYPSLHPCKKSEGNIKIESIRLSIDVYLYQIPPVLPPICLTWIKTGIQAILLLLHVDYKIAYVTEDVNMLTV